MKSLVIYDSLYGNTEKVAQAISNELSAKAIPVSKVDLSNLSNLDLLVVGTPVHGGRPTQNLQSFLKTIPPNGLKGINIAAFDTRMDMFIAKLFGPAADRLVKTLENLGGNSIAPPTGFIVEEKEGPLKKGELDKAIAFAKTIIR